MSESGSLRETIAEHGQSPRSTLLDAVANNEVVGVGECHLTPTGSRALITELMPDFKARGITDLAIEAIPAVSQPALNQLASTGELGDRTQLPWLTRTNDFVDMLKAAKREGIRVHAVDDDTPHQRDMIMTSSIEKILREQPNSKVLFLVGASHLKRGEYAFNNHNYDSFADRIRHDGHSLFSTVELKPLCDPDYARESLPITEPKAFDPHESATVADQPKISGGKLGDWDAVIAFPTSQKNQLTFEHSQSTDANVQEIFEKLILPDAAALVTDLNMRDTKITDASLPLIAAKMPKLEQIDLRETAVTAQGVAELRKERPNLKVIGFN